MSDAVGTLLAAPTVTVAMRVTVPVQPMPANLLYVTLPVTPVDGNPPVNVADMVAELPTVIGELTNVVMVGVALVTVTGAVAVGEAA